MPGNPFRAEETYPLRARGWMETSWGKTQRRRVAEIGRDDENCSCEVVSKECVYVHRHVGKEVSMTHTATGGVN